MTAEFRLQMERYFENKSLGYLSKILNDSNHKAKFQNISYRELNSWEKEGLLPSGRDGDEWRKFSIIRSLWIKLIKELREFGFGRERIRITKSSLEVESGEFGSSMPLLEFFVAQAVARKVQVLLLVFKNGMAIPCDNCQYEEMKLRETLENHVLLDLNVMLSSLLADLDLSPPIESQSDLSLNEIELLAYLRLGSFEKITIKLNNGHMEKFEGVRRLDGKTRIEQLIREHAYQDIEIREEGGRATAIFQTIKKKFTNGSKPA